MKKLTALIAMAVMLIVGGVYATWSYAGADNTASLEYDKAVYLAGTSQSGNVGTYAVTHNVSDIKVDQKDVATNDYTAVIVPTLSDATGKPSFVLTFTPVAGAGDLVKANGVKTYVYFGMDPAPQYDIDGDLVEEDVFTFKYNQTNYFTIYTADTEDSVIDALPTEEDKAKAFKWTKSGNSFTVTITLNQFSDLIAIDDDIVLNSIDKYNDFKTKVMPSGSINMHLHATTVQPTNA